MDSAALAGQTGVSERQLQKLREYGLIDFERGSRGRGRGREPVTYPTRAVEQVEEVTRLLGLYRNWHWVVLARWLQGYMPEGEPLRQRFIAHVRDALRVGLERVTDRRSRLTESSVIEKSNAARRRPRYGDPVLHKVRSAIGNQKMSLVFLNAARLFGVIEGSQSRDDDLTAQAINAVSPLDAPIQPETIPLIAAMFEPDSLCAALESATDDDLDEARSLTAQLHALCLQDDLWRDAPIPKRALLEWLSLTVAVCLSGMYYAR